MKCTNKEVRGGEINWDIGTDIYTLLTLCIIQITNKGKGTTQDEMAGWHHGLDGCESE